MTRRPQVRNRARREMTHRFRHDSERSLMLLALGIYGCLCAVLFAVGRVLEALA